MTTKKNCEIRLDGISEARLTVCKNAEAELAAQVESLKRQHNRFLQDHCADCEVCMDGGECAEMAEHQKVYKAELTRLTQRRIAAIRNQSNVLIMYQCAKRNSACQLRSKNLPECLALGCDFIKEVNKPYIDKIMQLRREDLGENIPESPRAETGADWATTLRQRQENFYA